MRCTFVNDGGGEGRIVVDKVTVPAAVATPFNFVTGGNFYGTFALADDDPPNEQVPPSGAYVVRETAEDGWALPQFAAGQDADGRGYPAGGWRDGHLRVHQRDAGSGSKS